MFILKLSRFFLGKIKQHQNSIFLFLAILGIFITVVLVIGNMSAKAVAEKSVEYLNEGVLPDGQTATLINFSRESGLIKIRIKIADRYYDSYATKDGRLFFPEALHMDSEGNEIIAE